MERGSDAGQGKRFWRQQHERQSPSEARREGERRTRWGDSRDQEGRRGRGEDSRGRRGQDTHDEGSSHRFGRDRHSEDSRGRYGRDSHDEGSRNWGRDARSGAGRRPAGRGGQEAASRRPDPEENAAERGTEIVYGRHPVNELMHSGRPVQRLHVLANAQGIPKDIFTLARERAIPVVHTDRERLDYLCNHANHQGVVAEAGGGQFAEATEVMERPVLAGECPFFLVLDGVQDPGNFGAILRSAEAAGVHGVFVAGDSSCGLTGTVSKASAGADQYIPVARVPKLSGLLRIFRENGYVIAGTEVEGSVPYTEVDYTPPTVIVMGAEEAGLRPSVREQCTALVRLPMRGKVQSLNVSAATAVILYEVVRQR